MKNLKFIALLTIASLLFGCEPTTISLEKTLNESLIKKYNLKRADCKSWKVPKEKLDKEVDISIVYCKCKNQFGSKVDYIFSNYNNKLYPAFGQSFKLLNYTEEMKHPIWVNNVEAYDYIFNNAEKEPSVSLRPNFFE